jgi:putative glutamine amidotransferase
MNPKVGLVGACGFYDFVRLTHGVGVSDPKEVKGLDIVIFLGGADVSPEFYREEMKWWCGATDLRYDLFQDRILMSAIEQKVKVLGICRGHQLVNAALGGKLYQDIEIETKHPHNHYVTVDGELVHNFRPIPEEFWAVPSLARLFPVINSYHHQAVRIPGDGQVIILKSRDDIVEATTNADGSIVNFQFHPEWDGVGEKYFQKVMKTGQLIW